ncbi:hypothetical protein GTY23_23105 [Streptomyces sp. SID5998]|nr:hypothetical protein [Streptomyces sp. SID5998]
MDQATHATTPTAPTATAPSADRAAYQRAKTVSDQLLDQVQVLPDTVETRREMGTDAYGIRLHFGTGLTAGRGVLEVAAVADAEVSRDDARDGITWIELHTRLHGVPLIARALTTRADADQLLQQTPATPAQPIPTVGTTPTDVVAPAMVPVISLAKAHAQDTFTQEVAL